MQVTFFKEEYHLRVNLEFHLLARTSVGIMMVHFSRSLARLEHANFLSSMLNKRTIFIMVAIMTYDLAYY